jgi:hypothetical protein
MRGDAMSVTKEFAVKIDTELSSWYHKRWDLSSKLDVAEDTKKFYEKHYPTRVEEIQKLLRRLPLSN